MSTVTVSWTLASQTFPSGTVLQDYYVTINDASSNALIAQQQVAPGSTSAVFDNISPGTYTASVVAADTSNNKLGTTMTSNQFTVSAPPSSNVTIPVPSSVSVSIS